MKTFAAAAITGLLLAAVQADTSVYVPSRNITCTGYESDGHIGCEPGHLYDAGLLDTESDTTPTVKGREPDPLDKRVTCNISGGACFAHCLLKGYCNSHCNKKNICICSCKDKTPWWNILKCSKTSC